jgi:hypothetical protein
MGALCAAQGDADGASRAWHKVIEEDQQDELVVAAALALAAVSALKADYQFARELLEIAGACGWTSAGTCTAAFDFNPLVRADARRRLHDLAEGTDASNFLGSPLTSIANMTRPGAIGLGPAILMTWNPIASPPYRRTSATGRDLSLQSVANRPRLRDELDVPEASSATSGGRGDHYLCRMRRQAGWRRVAASSH